MPFVLALVANLFWLVLGRFDYGLARPAPRFRSAFWARRCLPRVLGFGVWVPPPPACAVSVSPLRFGFAFWGLGFPVWVLGSRFALAFWVCVLGFAFRGCACLAFWGFTFGLARLGLAFGVWAFGLGFRPAGAPASRSAICGCRCSPFFGRFSCRLPLCFAKCKACGLKAFLYSPCRVRLHCYCLATQFLSC